LDMLGPDGDLTQWTDAHTEALREAVAVYAAEGKDAERYHFLRDDFSPIGLNIDGNHAWAYRRNATLKGPTLDAAIDAAIAERTVFGAA
jgi:hypothetical protein